LGFATGGLVVPAVALALETFGWRSTAFGSGILLIVLGLPLAQLIRRRPEDYGEVVDGIRDSDPESEVTERFESIEPEYSAREAIRTPAFWLISLGHGASLLVVGAVSVHLISHLKDELGYSVGSAAFVVTMLTSVQVVGIFISGMIGDRVPKHLLCAACMLMHMLGMLLVTFATSLPMVLGFVVLHGLAWGVRGPLVSALRADYFGRTSFGVIMGLSASVVMWFQISGPLLAGFLADATGDYRLGFSLLACFAGSGTMFFLLAKRPARHAQSA
jgi:MFS family permease